MYLNWKQEIVQDQCRKQFFQDKCATFKHFSDKFKASDYLYYPWQCTVFHVPNPGKKILLISTKTCFCRPHSITY